MNIELEIHLRSELAEYSYIVNCELSACSSAIESVKDINIEDWVLSQDETEYPLSIFLDGGNDKVHQGILNSLTDKDKDRLIYDYNIDRDPDGIYST